MKTTSTFRWSRLAGPALILLAASVAVVPQMVRGTSCGHDFDFHLVSWLDAVHSWRNGILYPHWSPSSNFGAGEPRFVFYPPLTWMLGAALGLCMRWSAIPGSLTFLLLAATGLATRKLAREALRDSNSGDGAATLAGCAALFSGYALFTAYERSAFGELTGGFWIPLALLYILRDRNRSAGFWPRTLDGAAVPLALVVAGAWLSNAPVGVMVCYLSAAVALAAALLRKSWAPVVRTAIAVALGMGLAALYVLPAAWEQRWVDIRQATDDPGEMIQNSWLFARHANPLLELHDVELLRVSLIAVTMLAVALAGLLVAWLRGRLSTGSARKTANPATNGLQPLSSPVQTKPLPRRWWIPLALMAPAVVFLQLPLSLPVWNLLPKLRFLQFPWRWLVALEAPMAIFFALAVWPARRGRRMAVAAVCAAAFLAATAAEGLLFYQHCDEDDAVLPMFVNYLAGAGFEGTDEYAPPGADNSLVPTGLPAACLVGDPATVLGQGAEGTVPAWDPAQKSCAATFPAAEAGPEHLRIAATTAQPGYLVLRLRSYPAWRVTVNGQPAASLPWRDDGLMAVPVPRGSVDLSVDWTTTPDVLAGRWLSLLAVLLLTALCLLERKLGLLERKLARPHLS